MRLNVQKIATAHVSVMNLHSFSFDQTHGARSHSSKFAKHFPEYLRLVLVQNTQTDLVLFHVGVIMAG